MNIVKVSVITVVFNNVVHISGAIESVLSQEYPFIEYILIDGGSTDGTLDVIEEYRDRIHILLSEPDCGIYDALNKGIDLASGEIIGFLHSDDLFAHDSVISSIVEGYVKFNADVVYGDIEYVQVDNVKRVMRYWRAGLFSQKKLNIGWMPPHPSVYVSRQAYKRLGGFDLTYRISADYDFLLRMLSDSMFRVHYLSEVLVKMRLGGTSNRSLSNIIRKSIEDYRALKSNGVGGVFALFWKNISKIPQFIMRG
jgi:glycosyltransferase involved in cell wall biosynthesis